MDIEKRMDLIKQTGEEIITEEELKQLLQTKVHPVAYDGFEPSGQMHIAQGIMRSINTNKLLEAGVHFKFWVADWFGWMNNKMGGDLEKIKKVGEYQIEVWKACGMRTKEIEFLWASDAMAEKEYWKRTINIARHSTVQRIIRCSQIMGRKESDNLSAAQIFYPCMQASDIFHLKADITNLGMDQRKVNILAREIAPELGLQKPVVVSCHMLMGLQKPPEGVTDPVERAIAMKMSKSMPDSAIFMTDTEDDIKRKIKNAYCPEKQISENPVMEYCKHIIFERVDKIKIERPAKFGGDLIFESFHQLSEAFKKGELHPMDLKNAVAFYINEFIEPVRKHFSKGKPKELLDFVLNQKITR
ncbi:MAG: tyrosine--tRNA ligase [Candidatus Aenigmarchaeota archaeon]|nr:tyrosine--tRNA ligase [Candidatus Aenigmarchaeota archaeon]